MTLGLATLSIIDVIVNIKDTQHYIFLMLRCVMQSGLMSMLSVVVLTVIMPMLSFVMIMLSVIMLSVVAPSLVSFC